MCRFLASTFLASLVAVLLPFTAGAQNMLTNPDFDTDTSGWGFFASWDPLDVAVLPTSGSATWINDSEGTGGALFVIQCVDISLFNQEFLLSGHVFIPSGNTAAGYSLVRISFWTDTACSDYLEGSGFDTATDSVVDAWEELQIEAHTPSGARSARIGVVNSKSEAGVFRVYAGSVFFGPSPATIFADGFEIGETTGWSLVVGESLP